MAEDPLILGLRGSTVGEDTKMYLSVANAASRMSWKEIFSSFPTTEWNFYFLWNLWWI